MEFDFDGTKMIANIIGEFQYNDKNYAVCSIEDNVDIHKIIILQTELDQGKVITKEIPDEEVEGVVNYFQTIKNSIMEEVYE